MRVNEEEKRALAGPEPVWKDEPRRPAGFPWVQLLLLPLGIALALGFWGSALGLGAAGVGCVVVSGVTALSGLVAVLTHGVGTTVLFLGGGLVEAGIGLLLAGLALVFARVGWRILERFVRPLFPERRAGA